MNRDLVESYRSEGRAFFSQMKLTALKARDHHVLSMLDKLRDLEEKDFKSENEWWTTVELLKMDLKEVGQRFGMIPRIIFHPTVRIPSAQTCDLHLPSRNTLYYMRRRIMEPKRFGKSSWIYYDERCDKVFMSYSEWAGQGERIEIPFGEILVIYYVAFDPGYEATVSVGATIQSVEDMLDRATNDTVNDAMLRHARGLIKEYRRIH